jgi:hypothetical protein
MTVVYNDNYTTMISAGKKCYLFTGLFKKTEISKMIKNVIVINTSERVKLFSIVVRSFIGSAVAGPIGLIAGAFTADTIPEGYFIVDLVDDDRLPVYTDDKYLIDFLLRYVK